MGYDAYVNCSCYKEGKTKPFLYSECVQIDEDGIYPSDDVSDEIYQEFYKWEKTACAHSGMKLVFERLANAWGMSEFRLLIEKLGGKDNFPVLTEYLPVYNGGTLPAEYACQAMEEVKKILNSSEKEKHLVLKDGDDTVISSTNDLHYIQTFIWAGHGRYTYSLYKDSFVIIEKRKTWLLKKEKVKIVFASAHFFQYRLSDSEYKFTDVDTQHTFICSTGLGRDKNKEQLECRVMEEDYPISENYDYILSSLEKLLSASIESGNPIIWC